MCFAFPFFLQMYIVFCSCAIFLAVVLSSCMIPTYDYAVLPFFGNCTFYFAVVNVFLQLYNLLGACQNLYKLYTGFMPK